ncbi:hypothetical protein QTP88_002674 [Uroleucon formosanum]
MYIGIEAASRVKRLRLKNRHIAMFKTITSSLNTIHLTSIRLFGEKLSPDDVSFAYFVHNIVVRLGTFCADNDGAALLRIQYQTNIMPSLPVWRPLVIPINSTIIIVRFNSYKTRCRAMPESHLECEEWLAVGNAAGCKAANYDGYERAFPRGMPEFPLLLHRQRVSYACIPPLSIIQARPQVAPPLPTPCRD